jgi:hypothetical protein
LQKSQNEDVDIAAVRPPVPARLHGRGAARWNFAANGVAAVGEGALDLIQIMGTRPIAASLHSSASAAGRLSLQILVDPWAGSRQ